MGGSLATSVSGNANLGPASNIGIEEVAPGNTQHVANRNIFMVDNRVPIIWHNLRDLCPYERAKVLFQYLVKPGPLTDTSRCVYLKCLCSCRLDNKIISFADNPTFNRLCQVLYQNYVSCI